MHELASLFRRGCSSSQVKIGAVQVRLVANHMQHRPLQADDIAL